MTARVSSPAATGGAGTTFEQHVGAYWLVQLLVGAIPPKERHTMANLLAGTALVVLFSEYEAHPVAVMEALSLGVPVLTSAVGSIPEVAGDCALYVDPRQQEDVEQGLLRILQDEDLRHSLQQRGPQRAASFSWERTAQATLQVYRQCLALRDR